MYISSDNEYVKRNITAFLSQRGYNVYRVISDGIVHSKSSGTLYVKRFYINGIQINMNFHLSTCCTRPAHLDGFTEHKGYYDLMIDWKALADSKMLLAWRNVKPKMAFRFVSTFAKSAKIATNKLTSYVLLDPDKIDSSNKNWPNF